MTITIRAKQVFAYGALAIMGLFVAFVVYWSAQPSTVLTIKNDPVPARPAEVAPDGEILLAIDFCQTISAVMVTEVHLLGEHGADIAVNWPRGRVEKGCNTYPKVPVPIPGQTPTDTYVAVFKSCADINPLKDHQCTTFRSQSFKVVNSKLNPGDAQVKVEPQ
jgi:hypothetical protein